MQHRYKTVFGETIFDQTVLVKEYSVKCMTLTKIDLLINGCFSHFSHTQQIAC